MAEPSSNVVIVTARHGSKASIISQSVGLWPKTIGL